MGSLKMNQLLQEEQKRKLKQAGEKIVDEAKSTPEIKIHPDVIARGKMEPEQDHWFFRLFEKIFG